MQELWSISYLAIGQSNSVIVDVQDGTYVSSVTDPADASVTLSFGTNGLVSIIGGTGSGYTAVEGDSAANYSVRFEPSVGSVTSGTVNTWLPLTSAVNWTKSLTTVGSEYVTGTLRIRRESTGTELDSATVTLRATVNAAESGGGGPGGGGGGGGVLP